jgi:hypothetical protein
MVLPISSIVRFFARRAKKRTTKRRYSTAPAAAWYFSLYLYLGFALVEGKTEIQKKKKHRSAEG